MQDILDQFRSFLEGLVQSNAEISVKDNLELNVQIIHNPGGGSGKRKIQTVLDNEIISKKKRHLYILQNSTKSER